MAKGKKTKKNIKPAKSKISTGVGTKPKELNPILTKLQAQSFFKQLKLSESYVSLVLGAIVVLALTLLFFMFIKNKSSRNSLFTNSATPTLSQSPTNTPSTKTYVLKDGEGLWDVAVKFYGDGFKWTEIAKANHLEDNPDNVGPGTKLIIPNIK